MAQTQHLDPENPFFEVFVCPELGILQCGGIEIFGKKCFCTIVLKAMHMTLFSIFTQQECTQTRLLVARRPATQF